jgi:hypothetical protein
LYDDACAFLDRLSGPVETAARRPDRQSWYDWCSAGCCGAGRRNASCTAKVARRKMTRLDALDTLRDTVRRRSSSNSCTRPAWQGPTDRKSSLTSASDALQQTRQHNSKSRLVQLKPISRDLQPVFDLSCNQMYFVMKKA